MIFHVELTVTTYCAYLVLEAKQSKNIALDCYKVGNNLVKANKVTLMWVIDTVV